MDRLIYSKKIFFFIEELKKAVRDILSKEVGLKVTTNRFLSLDRLYTYPIKVVIFNHKNILGYFESDFMELGFHQRLMYAPKHQLHDIIRHEIAHYLAFIEFGPDVQSHGIEFKSVCNRYNWGKDVSLSSCCIEEVSNLERLEESAVLRKIQKLMALSSSHNAHEAELAMVKSQELLAKHNLESAYIGAESEMVTLRRLMKRKREDAKMRAIAKILETFFVSIVYSRGGGFIYLEVLGETINVEIAEYVAAFLDQEFERLWKQTALKGAVAKNSFFLGLAKGYCGEIAALKQSYDKNALMVIEKKLAHMKDQVYPRLSRTTSSAKHCSASSALGESMGRNLSINQALKGKNHALCITS